MLTLNFTSTETTLQELYDQSMGLNDPMSSLNFTIALCQFGDLPGAYGVVSELLTNATPDPGEKVWATVFFVRGALNTRLGDFYAAAKDFSQAVTLMQALSLPTIAIPPREHRARGPLQELLPPRPCPSRTWGAPRGTPSSTTRSQGRSPPRSASAPSP